MRISALALCAAALFSCKSPDNAATDSASGKAESTASALRDTAGPYLAVDSLPRGFGSLSVTAILPDSAPADTAIFPIRDFEACGAQLNDNSIQPDGKGVSGALVWLATVNEGKQMSPRKRFDVTHQGCLLHPRVQSVSVGGTLNVRNLDQAVHVLRFVDVRTKDTLAKITQSERGQVVPIEFMLDVPRTIEITCQAHPWTRGWIHVFDHPYHAVTGKAGVALLDSVPAGDHELVVWHERFGDVRTPVKISAGIIASSTVDLPLVRR